MSELWTLIGTIVFGLGWLYVGCFIIAGFDYTADHVGGWLMGMTPAEVDEVREWRERQESSVVRNGEQ